MSVIVRNNIYIIILILFFSCKNTRVLKIETNSLNSNFIPQLIDSLPVKKGDTILFRNWRSFVDTISIYGSDNKKYSIRTDSVIQFFKTDSRKYKTKKITVLDKQNQSIMSLETNVLLTKDRPSYDPVRPPCYFSFIKKSDSIGQMEFEYYDTSRFILDFKINNNALHIIKMSDSMTYRGEEFNYNLDTLIVYNNKNRLIKSDELNNILKQKKNRIYSEEAVVKLTDTKDGYSVLIKSQTNDTLIVNALDWFYPKNSLEIRESNDLPVYLPKPNVRGKPSHPYNASRPSQPYNEVEDYNEFIEPFDKMVFSVPQSALHRDNIKIPTTIPDERFKIRVIGYYKVNGKEIKVYSDWIYVDKSFFD